MTRHEAGETLASIARTYDCSPPAISYIVSKNRARNISVEAPALNAALASEPQLIKTHAGSEESRSNHQDSNPRLGEPAPGSALRAAAERPEGRVEGANGQGMRLFAPPHQEANGERRTLHLSLGNGSHGNGGGPEPQPSIGSSGSFPGEPAAPRPAPAFSQGFAPPPRQPYPAAARNGGNGGPSLPPAYGAGPQRPQENGAFIDRSLRERVDTDIAAFLAAFDTALDHDTPESRAGLREATDRLLRAGARTRIELERLEARMPLPPRDRPRESGPAWPQR